MKRAGSALPGPVPAGWAAALLEVGVRRVAVWSRTDEQEPEENEGEQGYQVRSIDILLDEFHARTAYITLFTSLAVASLTTTTTSAR